MFMLSVEAMGRSVLENKLARSTSGIGEVVAEGLVEATELDEERRGMSG
jgi:hypothetical protein